MEMIMMMDPAVKCLCLLAVVAVLFVTEKLPLAVTSVFAAIFCWLLGLVPIEQVFLGLADSTVVLFGGMFVLYRSCPVYRRADRQTFRYRGN